VSETRGFVSLDDLGDPICWYCGADIEDPDQECMALDDGRCRP
jgi:hypothetical protein